MWMAQQRVEQLASQKEPRTMDALSDFATESEWLVWLMASL